MWRGLAQGLSERRTMPSPSSVRNSDSALRSLSGSRRRLFAKTGRPVVSMVCCTPWRGLGVAEPSPMTDGNSDSSSLVCCERFDRDETRGESGGWEVDSSNGRSVLASLMHLAYESTKRRWDAKKSAPKIGLSTAAKVKSTLSKVLPPNRTVLRTVPKVGIPLPSAPFKVAVGLGEENGKTHTEAPVSARNGEPLISSVMKVRPPTAFTCCRRFPSFPRGTKCRGGRILLPFPPRSDDSYTTPTFLPVPPRRWSSTAPTATSVTATSTT